jgi:hypothetical protein
VPPLTTPHTSASSATTWERSTPSGD